jgi:hypothetical protein
MAAFYYAWRTYLHKPPPRIAMIVVAIEKLEAAVDH